MNRRKKAGFPVKNVPVNRIPSIWAENNVSVLISEYLKQTKMK